jgi:hypothetical protein
VERCSGIGTIQRLAEDLEGVTVRLSTYGKEMSGSLIRSALDPEQADGTGDAPGGPDGAVQPIRVETVRGLHSEVLAMTRSVLST